MNHEPSTIGLKMAIVVRSSRYWLVRNNYFLIPMKLMCACGKKCSSRSAVFKIAMKPEISVVIKAVEILHVSGFYSYVL